MFNRSEHFIQNIASEEGFVLKFDLNATVPDKLRKDQQTEQAKLIRGVKTSEKIETSDYRLVGLVEYQSRIKKI